MKTAGMAGGIDQAKTRSAVVVLVALTAGFGMLLRRAALDAFLLANLVAAALLAALVQATLLAALATVALLVALVQVALLVARTMRCAAALARDFTLALWIHRCKTLLAAALVTLVAALAVTLLAGLVVALWVIVSRIVCHD